MTEKRKYSKAELLQFACYFVACMLVLVGMIICVVVAFMRSLAVAKAALCIMSVALSFALLGLAFLIYDMLPDAFRGVVLAVEIFFKEWSSKEETK